MGKTKFDSKKWLEEYFASMPPAPDASFDAVEDLRNQFYDLQTRFRAYEDFLHAFQQVRESVTGWLDRYAKNAVRDEVASSVFRGDIDAQLLAAALEKAGLDAKVQAAVETIFKEEVQNLAQAVLKAMMARVQPYAIKR